MTTFKLPGEPGKLPDKQNKLSGKTGLYGIFGNPIRHSLSPQMHNAAFEALGLNHVYLPFEVSPEQLQKAVAAIVPLGIRGLNITIPHKETVLPFLDEITPEALRIGAVNTIEVSSGRLIGHNTDGKGFVSSLFEAGVDPAGMSVFILGAGGAAKGVAMALLDAGVSELFILVRRQEKGTELAKRLSKVSPQTKVSVAAFDSKSVPTATKNHPVLLINTTPLGMKMADALPFPTEHIQASWVVADLIYTPYETPLLLAAKNSGALTVPGLGMLLHQGVLAFEIWTKQKPPLEIMQKTLFQAFKDLQ